MTRLADLARVVRSKNAGPTLLTIDLLFDTPAQAARAGAVLTPAAVSALYGAPARVIAYPPGNAIKIVMARAIVAGDPGDRDVYGAQQHALLLEVPV
ncbi:MAG: DUF4387 domain-containing protein [Burkholderiales bacterium]|nr:DUF4387 domain-containing protein [Burkholderiales bacterium]